MDTFFTFTFFGYSWIFIVLSILFVISLFVSDITEAGEIAFFTAIIFLGVNYFWGNFPVMEWLTWKNLGMYFFIGFLFSIVRTFAKGRELTERQKESFYLTEHVSRWITLWPIALINWISSRLIKDVWNFVWSKVERMYLFIFNM